MLKTATTLVLTFAVLVAGLVDQPVVPEAAAATRPRPVILVHGYNDKKVGCDGILLASYWRAAVAELTERQGLPAADVIPVAYYECDRNGVDITGYGPTADYPMEEVTEGRLRDGHTSDTSITRIAQDLAWFIFRKFTQRGRSVTAVGHSMGGLILREALRRVQAGDPAFPPRLVVRIVLTIATPHNGWSRDCSANTQCEQMTVGSTFLSDLQQNPAPQGRYGTAWWAMATSGELVTTGTPVPCDGIPTDSATAVAGTALVYTDPCYRHNAYLNDDEEKLDAEGSAALGGRHSIAMMGHVVVGAR